MNRPRRLCNAALAMVATFAQAGSPPVVDNGEFLVDASGRALYVHGSTFGEVLACTAACERAWPPLIAASERERPPAGLSLLRRRDGRPQWAYRGQALHLFGGEVLRRAVPPAGTGWSAVATTDDR